MKIDKDIPSPARKKGIGRRLKYPYDRLEINDSFYAENGISVKVSVCSYNKRHPETEFITAKEGDGVRVWRVR